MRSAGHSPTFKMQTSTKTPKYKWRKILYEDQNVPDNYVDDTFLVELKRNLYIRHYDFWTVANESGLVTQQISGVCLFVVAFIYMYEGDVSAQFMFGMSSVLAVLGYLINISVGNKDDEESTRTGWDDMKTALIFVSFGFGLSPVLMTLTDTISTDTIYAMTAAMLLAHLLFHDYGADTAIVSQSVSLNAAIFASVCLASRLPSTFHAFTTVSLALEIFALWPSLRKKVKTCVRGSQVVLTTLLGAGALLALVSVSSVAAVLFLLGHIFITFVCPAWLIRLQPYKNNIYGPWDEAVVQD